MSDWLKKYNEGTKKIENVNYYIEHLANLLYEVGNYKLAKKLNMFSNDLSKGLDLVKESHNENFNEQIKQAQENSANVFNAIVAGMKLKEKK